MSSDFTLGVREGCLEFRAGPDCALNLHTAFKGWQETVAVCARHGNKRVLVVSRRCAT